jgi:hypothetical protein
MAWTAAVALSATLVVLTLIGVVGFWWAAFTAECRQAPAPDIRRPSDQ